MEKYISTSLETHLFFGRIMKEHALFLQAAFPAGETGYRTRANRYRDEFEKITEAHRLSCRWNGWRRCSVLWRGVHGIYRNGRAADGKAYKNSH